MSAPVCQRCKKINSHGAKFCSQCGGPLPETVAPKQMTDNQSCFFLLLAIGAVIWGASAFFSSPAPTDGIAALRQVATRKTPEIGDEGMLVGAKVAGGRAGVVALSPSATDFGAYVDANLAGDEHGINELIASGKLLSVPVGTTRAKLLDSKWTGEIKVRILSGQYTGQAFWTSSECLKTP